MKTIFIAGHSGMFGSALIRKLTGDSDCRIITRSRDELDLKNQAEVTRLFKNYSIDQVYLAAARVGGIHANNAYPADFMYENLIIQCNVINAAFHANVKKLLFLGSSCIYPKFAEQPISEDELLSSSLEPTNEPYALAKIAGLKLCESYTRQFGTSLGIDYRSIMPTNLYGPGDNFHPENSHVIPGLISRLHQAKVNGEKTTSCWGTGLVKREFLHVDDAADAAIFLMNLSNAHYSSETEPTRYHINVGSGHDLSIRELMDCITKIVGYTGEVEFDTSKPDGPPRKLLNISRLQKLGWKPKIDFVEGLRSTYQWYLDNIKNIRT